MGQKLRKILLFEGVGEDGAVHMCHTNAPISELNLLEEESYCILHNGGTMEEIPIWSDRLKEKGYRCEFYKHSSVPAYLSTWFKDFADVKEKYYIVDDHKLIHQQR